MTTSVAPGAPKIEEIRIKDLHPHPQNRKHFDTTKLAELTANVEKEGVLVPLLVRPHGGSNQFQLVAGERRWRAAKAAKLVVVPCIVREMTDEQALEKLMLDNLQREDPHPLEEADTFGAWLEIPGHHVEALALKISKSVSHIYSRLQLRRLVESAREQMWDGRLPLGHAQLIARLEPGDQEEALRLVRLRTYDSNSTTVLSLADFTRALVKFDLELKDASFPFADATLCPGAGACATCPKRTGFTDGMFPELAAAIAGGGAGEADPVEDTCLDGACWKSKEEAWIARQLQETHEKYGMVQPLTTRGSDRWPSSRKAPAPYGVWKKAKEGTKGAVPGVVVAIPHYTSIKPAPKLGDVYWVTLKPRPKADAAPAASTSSSGPTSSQNDKSAADEKKKQAWLKVEIPRRQALARALVAKVGDKLQVGLLAELIDRTGNQVSELLGDLGLPAKLGGDLSKLSAREIQQALVVELIADDLQCWYVESDHGRDLVKVAKLLGVDPKKVIAAHDAAVKKGIKGICSQCSCTEERACVENGKPCSWANKEQTLCTACQGKAAAPVKGGKKAGAK